MKIYFTICLEKLNETLGVTQEQLVLQANQDASSLALIQKEMAAEREHKIQFSKGLKALTTEEPR